MGAYMYPIVIKREPQKVRYSKEIALGNSVLTLAKLREHVSEDDIFSIYQTDEGLYSKTMLCVDGERMETQEEANARVAKEEAYMKGYNEFHSKK